MVSWGCELLNWIPPGISGANMHAITSNTKYFGYSSFYSVFIFRINNFSLQYTYSTNKKTIISMELNPIKKSIIAISFNNNVTAIYDIIDNKKLAKFRTSSKVISMTWIKRGVYLALYTKENYAVHIISPLSDPEPHYLTTVPFECHFLKSIIGDTIVFIFANSNGNAQFYRVTDDEFIDTTIDYGKEIVSVSVDHKNVNHVLIVFRDGTKKIYDVSEDINEISAITGGDWNLSTGCWVNLPAGHFITGDQESGIIRLWSPANSSPIESFNVYTYGFRLIQKIKKNFFLCVFNDNRIAVCNMRTHELDWSIASSHSNTIFCSKFDPNQNNILYSAGADGIFVIHDIDKHENIVAIRLKDIQYDGKNSIMCMDICKSGVYAILGLRSGYIVLINLRTYSIKTQYKISDNAILDLSINPSDEADLLLWTDGPQILRVDRDTRAITQSYISPHDSHCAFFSKFTPNLFATACDGGYVDIYREDKVTTFKWGDNPYLHLCWSLHDDKTLIVATEDGLIFKTDVSTEDGYFTCIGTHRCKVRAMAFHPIFDNIVVTGGYDGFIQFYDIEKRIILLRFFAHVNYIYSVEFCPTNPFSIITSGRDSTVRFWSLEVIFYNQIIDFVLSNKNLYLRPICGYFKLMKLVNSMKNQKQDFVNGDIVHIKDKIEVENEIKRKSKARKSKEKLLKLAEKSLLMGDNKKYCQILFDLGEYDKCLATAPSVSFEYWQEMTNKVSEIVKNPTEKAIYKMYYGDMKSAAEIYAANDDFTSSFLCISTATLQKNSPTVISSQKNESEVESQPYLLDLSDMKQIDEKTYLLATQAAKEALQKGEIYMAASYFLSIGDYYQALSILTRCGELFCAVTIDRSLHLHDNKLRERFARLVLSNVKTKAAFDGLTQESKWKVMSSLYFKSDEIREKFLAETEVKMPTNEPNPDNPVEKSFYYLYQFRYGDAVILSVNELQKQFTQKEFDYDYCGKFVEILELFPIANIGIALSAAARGVALYYHAYKAAWKGYVWCFEHIFAEIETLSANVDWFHVLVENLQVLRDFVNKKPQCTINYCGRFTPNPNVNRNHEKISYGANLETKEGLVVSHLNALQWKDLTSFPVQFDYVRLF